MKKYRETGFFMAEINIYEQVINKLPFPLLIWKGDTNKIKCVHNNRQDTDTETGILFGNYILDKSTKYRDILDLSREEVIIRDPQVTIYLTRICQNVFYELHEYINTDNYHSLAIISQRIRGPLTNIIGMLTLLEDLKPSKKQKTYLNVIKRSSLEVVTLANDIVDVMNIQQGRLKLTQESTNLKSCFKECIEIVRPNAKKNNLELRLILGDIPKMAIIDSYRVQQVILCLLTNSIKYTDTGAVVLDISEYKKKHRLAPELYKSPKTNQINLLIKIRDTGTGIDNSRANIIREMLNNNNLSQVSYKSSGFGMIIARYLVNLMNGNIWFDTHIELGTVFYFNIIINIIQDA